MNLGQMLLAAGTGAGQGYLSGEMERRRREEAEIQRQNSLLMGLAPYLRGQVTPEMSMNLFQNNQTAQGLAPLLQPKEKPFDIDEVTRLGKSLEMYDEGTKNWRTPAFSEVYPIVKNPEAAIQSGRFRFREPTSLSRTPSGKDPGVWRKAVEAASQVVMSDFSTMGMPYDEKMQAIMNQAEIIYPQMEKLRQGKPAPKKKPLGPPTPNQ